jgi:hypothetical protein
MRKHPLTADSPPKSQTGRRPTFDALFDLVLRRCTSTHEVKKKEWKMAVKPSCSCFPVLTPDATLTLDIAAGKDLG